MPPRPFTSLYLHVPFCRSKCGYCAFYSETGAGAELRAAWLQAMLRDFAEFASRSAPLRSVYIGGGTPTLLTSAELNALFQAVRAYFRLEPDAEIAIEANPETIDRAKAETLAQNGVTRVSLGIQSFQPEHLRILDRAARPEHAESAIRFLHAAGISNLGADLIYGIPGQTLEEWRAGVRRACSLGIRHLSAYELTPEEGALLSATLPPVQPEPAAEMWEATERVAAAFGFRRYEVSNLAQPGFECRHNLDIWLGGTYLGCGPSAVSFDGEVRTQAPANLAAWLRSPRRREDRLPPRRRAAEMLAFGMRTVAGWSFADFRARTGYDALELRGPILRRLAEEGLLELTPERVRPSRRGLLLADALAEELLF